MSVIQFPSRQSIEQKKMEQRMRAELEKRQDAQRMQQNKQLWQRLQQG